MNNLLLRKSVSPLSSNRISAVASLFHSFNFSSLSSPPSNQNEHFMAVAGIIKLPPPTAAGVCRGFHVGAALGVRASSVSLQHTGNAAVADYTNEERSTTISSNGLEIAKLGISQEIVSALARKGITSLFPIQRAVLEPAMQGRDMIGRARTGTGKTLAFGIPVMEYILQSHAKIGKMRYPMALVLAPTRELAKQVDKEFYEAAPSLDTLCAYGGVPISRQMGALDRGVDVVVGTPGRIIDLLRRGVLHLSEVKFVVIDEADEMLKVGFAEHVETILQHLPRERQSMMFSATMPSWIVQLTHKYLNNPLTIDLVGNSEQKLADGITLYSIVSETYDKPSIIGPLIKEHGKGGKCILFTQTKRDADRLAHAMKDCRCEPLHGDITQDQRERTLAGFRDGRINVLVATDVAARGLDVPNVDLVIHYELPNNSEYFVHRSGRTGRAGKKGSVILIHSADQIRDVKGIEREVGCKFVELPTIHVEPGARITLGFGNSGFGAGAAGFYNSPAYDRIAGFSYRRTGGFSSPHRPGSFGGPSSGGSDGFVSDRSGSYGNSNRSSGFGSPSSGYRSGFGEFPSGRSTGFGTFGNPSSGQRSGSQEFASGHSTGFGNLGFEEFVSGPSARSTGVGNQRSSNNSGSHFGMFGEDKDW